MSDEDCEHPLVDAIDLEDVAIPGDPIEYLDVVEARIEELEEALDVLDEDDPQHEAVRFELGMLRKGREAVRERHDVVDEEGSR